MGLYTLSLVCSTVRTAFLHCSFYRGFVRPPRPKRRLTGLSHDSPFLTFFFYKELFVRSFFLSLVIISSNQVIKNRRNTAPLLIKCCIINIKFIFTFGIIIPVKCSYCCRLNLPDCKVASKSKLCGYYMVASGTVYLSYNVYGNNPSILYGVLDEKKYLNVKECEIALLLRNMAFKLLRLKD